MEDKESFTDSLIDQKNYQHDGDSNQEKGAEQPKNVMPQHNEERQLETKREASCWWCFSLERFRALKESWNCLNTILCCLCIIIVLVTILGAALGSNKSVSPTPCGPSCHYNWIGFQGKCYYFSKEEKNWNLSRDFCSSNNASLARIGAEEMEILKLFKFKDVYWIGLSRDKGQPWKWLNGENTTLEVMGDGGNCAYLNDEAKPSSSRCTTEHRWICSKVLH